MCSNIRIRCVTPSYKFETPYFHCCSAVCVLCTDSTCEGQRRDQDCAGRDLTEASLIMLQRLGLRRAENGHSSSSQSSNLGTSKASAVPTHVLAPAVNPHLTTRYFKVVHRGRVAVRSDPVEPAPEDGQVG